MLRKTLIALAIALVGLFAASTPAMAAPYPPPPSVSVAVNTAFVSAGGTVDFTGSGYSPGELITITVYYRTASGALVAGGTYTVRADANGNFSLPLELTQNGTAVLTAVGATSGRTGTLTVQVQPASSPTSEGTTTVPGAPDNGGAVGPGSAGGGGNGGSGGTNTGTNSANSGNVPGGGSSVIGTGGLASTGASIAGPLTVGAITLMVGLALLFFGTRLAIRRRSSTHIK